MEEGWWTCSLCVRGSTVSVCPESPLRTPPPVKRRGSLYHRPGRRSRGSTGVKVLFRGPRHQSVSPPQNQVRRTLCSLFPGVQCVSVRAESLISHTRVGPSVRVGVASEDRPTPRVLRFRLPEVPGQIMVLQKGRLRGSPGTHSLNETDIFPKTGQLTQDPRVC